MSSTNQICPLHGLINFDFDHKFVRSSDGHVVNRVNLRTNSMDSNRYINKKLKGTIEVILGLPTVGNNKCIGTCDDFENDAIIIFIYNDQGNHCIFRYGQKTKVVTRIWYYVTELGFEDSVLRASVVDGMLYWVNGEQQPKSFVIDKAINFTNNSSVGDGTKYSTDDYPLDEVIFPMIKRPPRFAPKCEYKDDPKYNYNNLRKKLFQFKYCYEYKDFQRSAWSSISKVPLPQNELTSSGEWSTDIKTNNSIDVKINTGSHYVSKILIAAREATPMNSGSFFLFDEILKYDADGVQNITDDSEITVSFLNNKRKESIDTPINNRYSDNVPRCANDIILLDKKYHGLSYPLYGYEFKDENDKNIDINYLLGYQTWLSDFTDNIKNIQFFRYKVPFPFNIIYGTDYAYIFNLPEVFYANSTYSISFIYNDINYSHSETTGVDGTAYPGDIQQAFIDDIRSVFGNDFCDDTPTSIYPHHESESSFYIKTGDAKNIQAKVVLPTATSSPCYKSLKKGQYHPFGIIYNDTPGRYNIVFANQELFIPSYVPGDADWDSKYINGYWNIFHHPPWWAKTYRWCYIRNNTYTYFLYVPQVTVSKDPVTDKYLLDINGTLKDIRERYPNFIISDYVWQNGDRIRIPGHDVTFEILDEHFDIADPDKPVLDGFIVDDISAYLTGTDPNFTLDMVEIYRPNTEPQNTVYLEIGEEYEIKETPSGVRYHAGQWIDQTFDANGNCVLAATGVFDFGDVYFRYRRDSDGLTYPVEDSNFSDYYISNAIDVGREGAKIKCEEKRVNRVVRSENYLENTEYNQLNIFMGDTEYLTVSEKYGIITGIEQAGDVLKVIQPHKETSVYIGKVALKQATGSDVVSLADNVFSTVNDYTENRGTTYRHSMVSHLRYLYYFDESTGEFIRSSPNGQAPVSTEYLAKTYFEKKAKELREYSGNKDVLVGINADYEEVWISFIIGNEIETVVFSENETDKGIKYFCYLRNDNDFPELFTYFGDQMYSFVNGRLFLHDKDDVNLNTFYGKLQPCEISFVVNEFSTYVKRFKSIRISTNKNIWNTRFDIDPGLNYGLQKSILVPDIMESISNGLYSDILSNMINRAGNDNIDLLYSGEVMVGETMKVTLSNDTSEDVELREAEVKFLIST